MNKGRKGRKRQEVWKDKRMEERKEVRKEKEGRMGGR